MSKYIRPNWPATNKAINGSAEDRLELMKEINKFKEQVTKKIKENEAELRLQRQSEKIAILKNLASDAEVFYTGYDEKLFLMSGRKVKHGTKYMTVLFEYAGIWQIPYDNLQVERPDDKQINHLKSNMQLRKHLSPILDRIPFQPQKQPA